MNEQKWIPKMRFYTGFTDWRTLDLSKKCCEQKWKGKVKHGSEVIDWRTLDLPRNRLYRLLRKITGYYRRKL